MKKTSIYLPESVVSLWMRERKRFAAQLPTLLRSATNFKPTRLRLRQHQATKERCVVVSVYWPLALYNELHGFANSVRVSVSLLVTYLIRRLVARPAKTGIILNYGFQVLEWSIDRYAIQEELRFSSIPPPLLSNPGRKRTPKRI